jgi:hypothetical protein
LTITGGIRSDWGHIFMGIRAVLGTAGRQGINPFDAIRSTSGNTNVQPVGLQVQRNFLASVEGPIIHCSSLGSICWALINIASPILLKMF